MAEFEFRGWGSGLNNRARESELAIDELRKAENVDILPGGAPRKRQGYSRLIEGGSFGNLVSTPRFAAFRRNGVFCTTSDFIEIQEHFPVKDFCTAVLNDELIVMDGEVAKRVLPDRSVFDLGQIGPSRQPYLAVAEDAGGLYAGAYMLAITYVGASGQESGTCEAAYIQIPEGAGIQLTDIPQHESARQIRIYMSDVNSENLYFRTSLPAGQTSYVLPYKRAKKKLSTQFMAPLPPGRHLCEYNARLFTAVGNVLLFSEPLNIGMYDSLKGYIMFAAEITGLASVDGGIYVCDGDTVSFLGGASPDTFTRSTVSYHGVQPNTLTTVNGGFFASQLTGKDVAVWWSKTGVFMLGTPDGDVRPVKDTDVLAPQYETGFVSEVTRQGVKQLVSVMKNPESHSASVIQDEISVEVHRNGILL